MRSFEYYLPKHGSLQDTVVAVMCMYSVNSVLRKTGVKISRFLSGFRYSIDFILYQHPSYSSSFPFSNDPSCDLEIGPQNVSELSLGRHVL